MKPIMRSLVMITAAAVAGRAESKPKPAIPLDPVAAIVDAFQSHPVVALGNVEFRGNQQSHDFQLQLIRDARFAAVANDILVEFGNSRYQDIVDRFVSGEDVPYASLRGVWQNTTQIEYEWDLPIYEDFFRAVRAVNASLPRSRQLRVILGDPPIDWEQVHTLQDLHKAMGDRDGYALDVLHREALAKNRHVLVIYGGQHLLRKNTVRDDPNESAGGIIARLEKDGLARAFTILPETRRDLRALQADISSWRTPSLALLRGTSLGSAIWDQRRPVRIEEQFDAILYLGPPSSMTVAKLAPALCADRAYVETRLWRLALVPPPPGATVTPADQLKADCAHPGAPKEISDGQPLFTSMFEKILREAAQGQVNPDSIAPGSRDQLIPVLQRIGARHLAPAGRLESLVLLEDGKPGDKLVRRYRSVFASGLKVIWIVGLSPDGAIASLESKPE